MLDFRFVSGAGLGGWGRDGGGCGGGVLLLVYFPWGEGGVRLRGSGFRDWSLSLRGFGL